MLRAPFVRFVVSGIAALLAGTTARSEMVHWTFTSLVSPGLVVSNNHKLSWVQLTSAAGTVTGSSRLVLSNVRSASGSTTVLDVYTQRPFHIDLTITDTASRRSGKVGFSGVINGTASLFSSLITLSLTSPATQRLHLGEHIYDIRLDTLTPPGPTNSTPSGSIGATVTVTHNPEPSSLILAGSGAAAAALAWWRRRRATVAADR
jgi:hypothetical protein